MLENSEKQILFVLCMTRILLTLTHNIKVNMRFYLDHVFKASFNTDSLGKIYVLLHNKSYQYKHREHIYNYVYIYSSRMVELQVLFRWLWLFLQYKLK